MAAIHRVGGGDLAHEGSIAGRECCGLATVCCDSLFGSTRIYLQQSLVQIVNQRLQVQSPDAEPLEALSLPLLLAIPFSHHRVVDLFSHRVADHTERGARLNF
jgi:hypothetical protein